MYETAQQSRAVYNNGRHIASILLTKGLREQYLLNSLLPHAVKCGRFCFCRRQSVFFVCVRNISETAGRICSKFTLKTFGPSRGRVWTSRSKVKGQGHQGQTTAFSALSAASACMWFMFLKTSLASSLFFVFYCFLSANSCLSNCGQVRQVLEKPSLEVARTTLV